MAIFDALKTVYHSYLKPPLRLVKRGLVSIKAPIALFIINKRYSSHLKRLKDRPPNTVINVGFLVSEEAKWQYQSLYEEFEKSKEFNPIVLVSDIDTGEYRPEFYKSYQSHCLFFEKLGLRHVKMYDPETRKHKSPKEFNIDILFYQQPWSLPSIHTPREVSKYALTCYVPYGFQSASYPGMYTEFFHRRIWKNFVQCGIFFEDMKKLQKDIIKNCVPVGYAKLDNYFDIKVDTALDKKIVIYAPHHSFEENGLRFATFQHNGTQILRFAKQYRNSIHWVFKPHPRFKHAVISNGIMTEEEISAYYDEWESIGEVYDSANYESLFMQSSAMITDCCSFLGEYFASGNPIFHLWNENALYGKGLLCLSSSFYRIQSIKELKIEFERVVMICDATNKQIELKNLHQYLIKMKSAAQEL